MNVPVSEGAPEARGDARLRLGTCPDSWGVWFADDPLQTPWTRFLDEVAEVGYQGLELGPFGYLPSDQARLTDELGRRGLSVAGGTVHGFSGLHRPGDWPDIVRITRQVSELTAAVSSDTWRVIRSMSGQSPGRCRPLNPCTVPPATRSPRWPSSSASRAWSLGR